MSWCTESVPVASQPLLSINTTSRTDVSYWKRVYSHYGNNFLKDCVEKALNVEATFYTEIVNAFINLRVELGEIEFSDGKETRSNDENLLAYWIRLYHLPPVLYDGSSFPKKFSYENLVVAMRKINPEWLLEVAAFALTGDSFANVYPPNRDYNVTKTTLKPVVENLVKISGNLIENESEITNVVYDILADIPIETRNVLIKCINTNLSAGVFVAKNGLTPIGTPAMTASSLPDATVSTVTPPVVDSAPAIKTTIIVPLNTVFTLPPEGSLDIPDLIGGALY
jgi:hypothetical protein